MRLTQIFAYKFVKGIPGNIWIGKHRFVPPIKTKDRLDMWRKLMYEEEVMMYLRNPYLTEEEDQVFMEKYPAPRVKPFEKEPKPPLKPLKDRDLGTHFQHLNTDRFWKEEH